MIAEKQDFITPHITDSHHLEYPCFKSGWVCEYQLPHWDPIQIGSFSIDMSPTKHVVMLLLAATLCLVTLLIAARSQGRQQQAGKAPKGFANGIEALVLYLRQEVVMPNVGPHGDRYVPFILTLFFFILFANLLGLIPYGATATGNISVTATLAILAFIMIEVAGMRTLGPKGYMKTIIYWPHDQSLGMKLALTPLLTPDRARRQVHEANRARNPVVREHDGGAHRRARAARPDLQLRQLLHRPRAIPRGAWHHASRDLHRVPAGVRVCAS